jgi:hypothetical protein
MVVYDAYFLFLQKSHDSCGLSLPLARVSSRAEDTDEVAMSARRELSFAHTFRTVGSMLKVGMTSIGTQCSSAISHGMLGRRISSAVVMR